jgi:hypothetical protein
MCKWVSPASLKGREFSEEKMCEDEKTWKKKKKKNREMCTYSVTFAQVPTGASERAA